MLLKFSKTPLEWGNTRFLAHALKEIDLNTIYTEAEEENERSISEARGKGDGTQSGWSYQDCVIRALVILHQNKKALMCSLPDQAPYEIPRQRETLPGGNFQET